MEIKIPPYARWEVRSTGPFSVLDADEHILGPDDSSTRVFRVETAGESKTVIVQGDKGTKFTQNVRVRPSPFEKNDGVPVAVQEPVSEPTIQEMLRMYLSEYAERDTGELETPDEFFDFGDEDEQDLLTSPWEYTEMEEQFVPEAAAPEGGDSAESPDETPPENPPVETQTQEPTQHPA